MSRFLFATVPIAGHVLPFLAVASALTARGHDVAWYSGEKFRDVITRTGAQFFPYVRARDFDDAHIERAFPARARHRGLAQLKFDLKHVFGDPAPDQLADLQRITGALRTEVMIADPCMIGAFLFRELHGLPLLVVNVVANPLPSRDTAPFGLGIPPSSVWYGRARNQLLNLCVERLVFAGVQRHFSAILRRAGVAQLGFLLRAPVRASIFALPTVPGFEYPRSDLPAHVRFVGALHGPPPSQAQPLELAGAHVAGRPIVHVTQGTVSNVSPTLIGPALLGLAHEDVTVVVATGGRSAAELGLHAIPANAHVVPFVSYPALLPQTAVMVTNGGYGGVQLALSHGVPLVVWGTTEDKPETAARVAWSGAGLRLAGASLRPDDIRNAVLRVLRDPAYARRAAAFKAEYASFDGVAEIVRLAEGLVESARL